jgi:hypothetical protein
MNENVDQQPLEEKKGSKTLWIILGGVGGALVICIAAIIIIALVFDPWGIVSRLTGKYDPVAQAVPPETQMFMNVNLLQLQSKDFLSLVNTFVEAAGEEPYDDIMAIIDEAEETVEPETEITFSQDILPWLGQFVGLGIKDLKSVDFLDNEMDLYVIAEVRNKKKADEFLVKLMDDIRQENDQNFLEETYERTTIYELDTEYEEDRVAFARSGGLFILSNGAETIKEVIDASKGDSLGDMDEYKDVVSELPKDRLLTFYMSFSFVESFYEDLDLPTDLESSANLDILRGMGMSISAVEAGLQMDYIIAYNPDQMTDEDRASMQIEPGQPMTASLFPQETYLYITSEHLNRTIEGMQEGLLGTVEEGEIDEAMEIFEEQFGINPMTDLFPYLDGEWAIGIMESPGGIFAEQFGIPLNLLLVVESSDQAALLNAAEKIAEGLEDTGQFDVLQTETNGIQLFELRDPFYEETAFVYAVKDNILFISLDAGTIEDVYGDRVSLDQYSRYKDGWQAFPKDMRPMMYIDVEGIYRFVTEEIGELSQNELEDSAAFKPIKTIELAGRIIDEKMLHGAMIIFVEGDSAQ